AGTGHADPGRAADHARAAAGRAVADREPGGPAMTDFLNGLAPDHRPALIAVLLLVPGAWYVRWAVGRRRDRALHLRAAWNAASATVRWAAALLLVTAVVHLALPLGHHDSGLLTAAFLGSAVAYV